MLENWLVWGKKNKSHRFNVRSFVSGEYRKQNFFLFRVRIFQAEE